MAKKIFTDESLATLVDETKSYVDSIASKKANSSHTHSISNITNLQTTLDGKASTSVATQSTNGLMSSTDKTKLDLGGTSIVTTAGTGSAYTVAVDGITSLVVGAKITIIPHTNSTAYAPTLNVNNLGAKAIRMPVTYNTSATSNGVLENWIVANKPITVQYNGSYWLTVDLPRPSAQYLYGTVPIASGGTGATTATDALTNLGLTATATELNYCDGVTSNIQTQLDGKAASSHGTHVSYGTSASALGTSSAGSASTVSRSDHVHALPALTSCTGTLTVAKGGTGATTAAGALTNLGLTATATEINYCDGVTSNIQTQLDGKASSTHTHNYLSTDGGGLTGNLTISREGARTTYTDGTRNMWCGINAQGTMYGLYDVVNSKYIISSNGTNASVGFPLKIGNAIFTYDSTNKRLVISVS